MDRGPLDQKSHMVSQLSFDFGPDPHAFLYREAANDPNYARESFRHAREKRIALSPTERRRHWKQCMKMQRGFCGECGYHWRKVGHLFLDHFDALILGGSNAPHNFWLLCAKCHDIKTSQDIARAERARQQRSGSDAA